MVQLTPAATGVVYIAGQPYQRGLLRVKYSLKGEVSVWDPFGPVVILVFWEDFANPETGTPFDSFAALKLFIELNFFRQALSYGNRNRFPLRFPFRFFS